MKNLLLLLTAITFITACKKQNEAPTAPLNEGVDTTVSNLKYTGTFINGPHGTVSGMVNIYFQNGKYVLALKDIAVSNGPDLHVYLSKEVQPINFIDLGKLKSTMGNQVYDIAGSPDFSQYKYVLIHCQQYNHLFGSASLQ